MAVDNEASLDWWLAIRSDDDLLVFGLASRGEISEWHMVEEITTVTDEHLVAYGTHFRLGQPLHEAPDHIHNEAARHLAARGIDVMRTVGIA